MEKYEKKYHASGKTMEQVIPGYAPKLPPKGKTGFIRPDTNGEIIDFSTLQISEEYPTGWIVVDNLDVGRFNENEVQHIIEFNESLGRRCAFKVEQRKAKRISAEEITNAVLIRILTDIQKSSLKVGE